MKNIICKAILFDLDGVLVDSGISVERHWRQWAKQHDLDVDTVLAKIHGRRTLETIQEVAPTLPAIAEAQRLDETQASDPSGVVAIDGAAHLLSLLPPDQWAIVTSGSQGIARARLQRAALPIPPILISADEVKLGKPHPEGYLQAAARLGVEPKHCLVIEDAPPGIQAAHAAGIPVVAVASTYPITRLQDAEWRVSSLTALSVSRNGISDTKYETLVIALC